MDYIIFSCLLLIVAIFESKFFLKLAFLFVVIFFSTNYGYGFDWMNYRDDFINSLNQNYSPFFGEPVLFFFMKFIRLFTDDYSYFVLIFNAFNFSCVYYFCSKLKSPASAFFILFCFLSFYVYGEWIRQGLAISLLMIAVAKVYSDNSKKFIFSCVLLFFVHSVAIVSVLSVVFKRINFTNRVRYYFIISSFMSFLVFIIFHGDIFQWLPLLGNKISAYSSSLVDGGNGNLNFILTSKIIYLYLFVTIILTFKLKNNQYLSPVIGVLLVIIFTRFAFVIIRLGYYFVPFFVLYIDQYMSNYGKGLNIKLTKLTILFLILAISFIPVWSPLFWEGSKTHLTFFSTQSDFNRVIGVKCNLLINNIDVLTGRSCR